TKEILVADSETDSPAPKSRRSRRSPANDGKEPSPNHLPSLQVKRPSPKSSIGPKKPAAPKLDLMDKRNPHRRQVMKTFTDEDGFMVTEKVWEGASDEEDFKKAAPSTDAVVGHSVDGGVAPNDPPVAADVPANTAACLTGAPNLGTSAETTQITTSTKTQMVLNLAESCGRVLADLLGITDPRYAGIVNESLNMEGD
ncbi:hypothetical protein AHF37_07743, partial [Paragonimus kellicotti]